MTEDVLDQRSVVTVQIEVDEWLLEVCAPSAARPSRRRRARLGDRVTVKNAVLIWDGVVVDNDVFLGPNVVFTNDLRPRARVRRAGNELLETHVGAGATIGANATVVCGVTIGPHAFVAAGSVVTGDVAPNGLVAGNPAVHNGWVCECGEGLDGDLTCGSCGRSHDFDRRRPGSTAS